MFRRMDAARGREGRSSDQVWIPAPEDGGPRGALPGAKTSTMIMRPPQHGHGGRCRRRRDVVWVDGQSISLNAANPVLKLDGGKIVELSSTDYRVIWDSGEFMD